MDGHVVSRLGAGVHVLDAQTYHADPCTEPSLSSSIAKLLIERSPAHAWTASPRLNPNWESEDRKTFDIGRAAHRAVLGRGGDYVAIPEDMLASNGAASTAKAKAFIEEVRAAGKTPLKGAEIAEIEAMAAAVTAHLAGCGIAVDPERSELGAVARIGDVWCRAMIDNAPDKPVMLPGIGPRKVLLDLKTCESAVPDSCRRAVESYGYDVQKQHYVETWREAAGEDRAFLFVFTEKTPPFGCCIIWLLDEPGHSADWLEDASGKIATARATWRACLDADSWPNYPRMIVQVGATAWHRQRWQDTQVRAAATSPSPETLRRAMAWQAPE
jgi:hypothetical protein